MMTYKETLFFVGKCLTITHEKHNRDLVEKDIKSGNIDWDSVVRLSTSHYVFPALYCNLKRVNFLHILPAGLVEYMKHITDLNRERNQQIIEQAREINELLLSNNIPPIFLKGTGNLLEGLYEDIAERMVGDIDILVEKNNCETAFKLLLQKGYFNKSEISKISRYHRHLPRITNPNKIGAIEVHKEMLKKKQSKFFDYHYVKNSFINISNINFLSFENQIKLTVFSKFINDDAYLLKNISLRAAYDVFLLDKKLTKSVVINQEGLTDELNAGLKIYTTILNTIPLNYKLNSSKKTDLYLSKYLNSLNKNKKNSLKKRLLLFYLWFKPRATILFKSLFNKSYFIFVFSRLTDIKWYERKLRL